MKSEPLENKRKDVIVYLDDIDNSCNYDFKNSEDGEIFMFDDVKSAVMGLLNDIEKKQKLYVPKLGAGLEIAKYLIKKWFKDVIE